MIRQALDRDMWTQLFTVALSYIWPRQSLMEILSSSKFSKIVFAKRKIYSDADIICDIVEQTQTMDHLLKCPMLPQECTTEDLMEYIEAVKGCVFQWMNNV